MEGRGFGSVFWVFWLRAGEGEVVCCDFLADLGLRGVRRCRISGFIQSRSSPNLTFRTSDSRKARAVV